MAEIEVHKFCKKSSSKFNGINWAFIAIIFWIFVANEATFAKNSRQHSTKIGRKNNDDLSDSDGDFDLFGLKIDSWEDDSTEYHDHDTTLKRVARSPFDEDIDEKEDSDEDDDEGDDETNGSEKKSTTPSVTTTTKASNSSPVSIAKSSTHASTIDPSTKPTTDTSKIPPGSSSTLTIHVNTSVKPAPIPSISAGSGRALPPDVKPVSIAKSSTHAPTIKSSTKPSTDTKISPVSISTPTIHVNSSVKPAPIPSFSAGSGTALPPSFRPPGLPGGSPSGIPLPPGRKPGSGGPPHALGKIPPHLLK
ncbi:unnamed protein product [Orchesella dallaii]|uniref:Uncharacterized protein n=1 Tax=Orchesella dallaii TaxID=48710 RepID=A0ABP1RER6_9HEXA